MTFRSIALATGAGVFSARLFMKKLVTRGGREPKAGRAAPSAAAAPGAAVSATAASMAAPVDDEWPPQPPQLLDEALRALSPLETGRAPGIPFEEAVEWLRQARRRHAAQAEAAAEPGRTAHAPRASRNSTTQGAPTWD